MTSRTARRRLSTAITAVLAVTAGTALVSAPSAGAATAVAPAAVRAAGDTANAQDVAELPVGSEVTSAGPGGYLTSTEHYDSEGMYSYDYHWRRPDGTSTLVVAASENRAALPNAAVSDIVPVPQNYDNRIIRLRDMSAPADTAPVVFDLNALSTATARYSYVATIGSTLLVQVTPASGPKEFRLLAKPGDKGTKISGLPADLDTIHSVRATAGTALLAYGTSADAGSKYGTVTVDLATATAGTAHTAVPSGWNGSGAVDAAHTAWWQDNTTLVVADATGGAPQTIALDKADSPTVGLLGDWIAYGTATGVGGGTAGDPMLPLTARPIAGGEPVKLLDRLSTVVAGPNGTLLARGGTVEHGEGVYRIAPGADGKPTATLVSSTGEDTALTFKKTSIGPVVDLDPMNNRVRLSWDLSHKGFTYDVSLVHKATGKRYRYSMDSSYSGSFNFLWRGNFASSEADPGENAYNGEYRWELTAKPTNGIGGDLQEIGHFTVTRSPKVHDYTDNGSPDLLGRGSNGVLFRIDTVYDAWKGKVAPAEDPTYIGSGWNYPQMESVGDVAGTSAPDVIGVDSGGVLWLHPGTGDWRNPLGARVKVGGGWQIYNKLAGGSDLTGDGRADLVATDKSGVLWLYKGTGNTAAPFAPRKQIGTGWGIYNQLTATGNLAGGAAGDLVARDSAGVLWLYLGKGDGTFASRVKIGAGWNQYSQIVGVGDANMDGRNDLYVFGPNNTSYVYNGTGGWSAPFATRVPTDALINTSIKYTHVL
ncbi:FG-GAP repeat domain-containing protein [Streptomyces sp. NPDC004520]|uniref:FG-GAP repeat domain-containing protein n=1 Tax=Streptomyces sp. NPDC004520 TaxID=3364702 RepID=UPI0036864F4D